MIIGKKFSITLILLFGLFFGIGSNEQLFAYVLDGNLSDWGVTPFTDWVPTSSNIDYTVENNYNRPWSDPFSESFDLEAMYFDDDVNNLYFAIVSSFAYNGATVHDWPRESLFFDFSGRTYDQILLDANNSYKYAANLAPVPLDTLSTRSIHRVNQPWFYEEDHHNGAPYHFPVSIAWHPGEYPPYILPYHPQIGEYQVYNKAYNGIEGNGRPTYILEGQISKSLFLPSECTQPIELYFSKVTCIKDWITLRGTKTNDCGDTTVPEPATFMLLASGLLGAGFLRRRKK